MKPLRLVPTRTGAARAPGARRDAGGGRGCARRSCRSRCPGRPSIRSRATPAATARSTPSGEEVDHLGDHVVVAGVHLHRLRRPLDVHQAASAAPASATTVASAGSMREPADVVDQHRAEPERLPGHGCLPWCPRRAARRCVARRPSMTGSTRSSSSSAETRRGAGPGGLAAHVEHVRAGLGQPQPVPDGGLALEMYRPPSREAVRRHVHHAHDIGARARR